MTCSEKVRSLFECIDRKDADGFAGYLAEDAVFRFGNAEPVAGRDAVREMVAGFFQSIAALSHNVEQSWEVDGHLIAHGQVTYTRHDGTTLTVPFADLLATRDGLISEYLIFADVSELYAGA